MVQKTCLATINVTYWSFYTFSCGAILYRVLPVCGSACFLSQVENENVISWCRSLRWITLIKFRKYTNKGSLSWALPTPPQKEFILPPSQMFWSSPHFFCTPPKNDIGVGGTGKKIWVWSNFIYRSVTHHPSPFLGLWPSQLIKHELCNSCSGTLLVISHFESSLVSNKCILLSLEK